MNLICQKCGEILVDGLEHATPFQCDASIKELIKRVRQICSEGAHRIALCRSKNHNGLRVQQPLNICTQCLKVGYLMYQVVHEIVTSGRTPMPRIPLRAVTPADGVQTSTGDEVKP